MKILCVVLVSLAIGGCASGALKPEGPRVGEVVAELPPDNSAPAAREDIHTDEAVEAYRRVENTLPDTADNQRIDRRIADLRRRVGTERGSAGAQSYRDAIARYETLLNTPGITDREDILYHLAETYDLLGDTESSSRYLDRLIAEFPESVHRIEAHFRRGELRFSAGRFDRAAADYTYIVENGAASPFWLNANYMLGWTLLKQSKYEQSLDRFLTAIDAMLKQDGALDAATQEMLGDSVRAIVLAVTYLDGATTLADHLEKIQRPAWQNQVYEGLADDLHRKQRFSDSVATLEMFVERNPHDPRAPQFSERAIEILVAANFPTEARKLKQEFVTRYRFDGDYWTINGIETRDQYAPVYKKYLMEIAKLEHRDAQQNHDKNAYLAAAAYYRQFSETFPDDPAAGEASFLEGEALTDAHEPGRAVTAYQRVLHKYSADSHAADAGYAAILALGEMQRGAESTHTEMLKRTKIDAQIEYATLFPNAAHASEAQADAANELFEMKEFADASRLSQDLLDHRADLSPSIKRVVTLILAHIAFEQGRFDVAEARYRDVLRLSGTSGNADAEIRTRLLATIYKQAEEAEARGDLARAVQDYLRIADEDPKSQLAAKGHFDAVAAYESAKRWSAAADLLHGFRVRYPNDPLGADSDTRLAELYEKADRKLDAANAFHDVAIANAGTMKGQQALYHAGELYAAVDSPRAVDTFLAYEKIYPEPYDLALEGAQQLDVLYDHAGNETERERWLHTKIEISRHMGAAVTDRARYLAADAQFKLAEKTRHKFDSIELSGNLAKQLAAKRAALTTTVGDFEQAAGYGVSEFATASTYQIADTYAALARDVLASARPSGLSELEREQYDVLLEEQASPFEEQAIAIHEINMRRIREGIYDTWVIKSLDALRQLMPARYDREEVEIGFVDNIK